MSWCKDGGWSLLSVLSCPCSSTELPGTQYTQDTQASHLTTTSIPATTPRLPPTSPSSTAGLDDACGIPAGFYHVTNHQGTSTAEWPTESARRHGSQGTTRSSAAFKRAAGHAMVHPDPWLIQSPSRPRVQAHKSTRSLNKAIHRDSCRVPSWFCESIIATSRRQGVPTRAGNCASESPFSILSVFFPACRHDRQRPQPCMISGHNATLLGMPRPLPCFLARYGKADRDSGHSQGFGRCVPSRRFRHAYHHTWSTTSQ